MSWVDDLASMVLVLAGAWLFWVLVWDFIEGRWKP